MKIHFVNAGKAAAVFQVRSGNDGDGPWTYTVGAGDDLSDSWNFRASHETAYDLTVYGPNGFMRAFKGSLTGHGKANVAVQTVYEPDHDAVTLAISNAGDRLDNLRIANAYTGGHTVQALAPGDSLTPPLPAGRFLRLVRSHAHRRLRPELSATVRRTPGDGHRQRQRPPRSRGPWSSRVSDDGLCPATLVAGDPKDPLRVLGLVKRDVLDGEARAAGAAIGAGWGGELPFHVDQRRWVELGDRRAGGERRKRHLDRGGRAGNDVGEWAIALRVAPRAAGLLRVISGAQIAAE